MTRPDGPAAPAGSSRPRRRGRRACWVAASVVFAVTPWATLGFGTPVAFIAAAAVFRHLRRAHAGACGSPLRSTQPPSPPNSLSIAPGLPAASSPASSCLRPRSRARVLTGPAPGHPRSRTNGEGALADSSWPAAGGLSPSRPKARVAGRGAACLSFVIDPAAGPWRAYSPAMPGVARSEESG